MKRSLFVALLVLLTGGSAAAQGFLDVNAINVRSEKPDAQYYVFTQPLNLEFASFAAAYPKLPSAPGIDVSGGWISNIGLGLEANIDYVQYRSTVGLGISIPSPYFFNNSASDGSATSNQLDRQDIGVNIGAVYALPLPTSRAMIKVFGGPTYFNVHNEMVSNIHYTQSASSLLRLNFVDITSYDAQKVKGSGVGFHVGADVAFYFVRHVGVGGLIRYSHGTVTLSDPLSEEDVDLKVGKITLGGGLRFRF